MKEATMSTYTQRLKETVTLMDALGEYCKVRPSDTFARSVLERYRQKGDISTAQREAVKGMLKNADLAWIGEYNRIEGDVRSRLHDILTRGDIDPSDRARLTPLGGLVTKGHVLTPRQVKAIDDYARAHNLPGVVPAEMLDDGADAVP